MLLHQGYPIRKDFPRELVRISEAGDYIFNRDSIAFRRWRLRTKPSIPDSAFALNYLSSDEVYTAAQRATHHSLQISLQAKRAARQSAATSIRAVTPISAKASRPEITPISEGIPSPEAARSSNHLSQIAKQGNLSATEVQDSIHFFAFDLKRNEKAKEIKGAPINFFMGILRKRIPYAAPENYESPESEARRKYLESKRRLEAEREAQVRELQALEFSEWRRSLSAEALSAILPEYARKPGQIQDSTLRTHFEQAIWPARAGVMPGFSAKKVVVKREIEESLAGEVHE